MSYLPKLFSTGAIRKTPERIIHKIANEVEGKDRVTTIVEAGVGMGEITEAVIARLTSNNFHYYAFEIDEDSCEHLHQKFPQVNVVKESVFQFDDLLPPSEEIDYFISSIPFSFYKNDIIEAFLEKVKLHMKEDGKVIVLFTAAWLMPLFKKHFPGLQTEAFLTFPPYFLIVYTHHKK